MLFRGPLDPMREDWPLVRFELLSLFLNRHVMVHFPVLDPLIGFDVPAAHAASALFPHPFPLDFLRRLCDFLS